MEPRGLTQKLGAKTSANIVAEIKRPMIESLAKVLGPGSKQADLLNQAQRLNWQCVVYKLRDGTFIVVPN